jgi:pentatricopeptide repeat protein
MNGHCLHNRIDDARELFVLMEAKGHKRDVVSYNVLMAGIASLRNWKRP